jgi:hypothetical protein
MPRTASSEAGRPAAMLLRVSPPALVTACGHAVRLRSYSPCSSRSVGWGCWWLPFQVVGWCGQFARECLAEVSGGRALASRACAFHSRRQGAFRSRHGHGPERRVMPVTGWCRAVAEAVLGLAARRHWPGGGRELVVRTGRLPGGVGSTNPQESSGATPATPKLRPVPVQAVNVVWSAGVRNGL